MTRSEALFSQLARGHRPEPRQLIPREVAGVRRVVATVRRVVIAVVEYMMIEIRADVDAERADVNVLWEMVDGVCPVGEFGFGLCCGYNVNALLDVEKMREQEHSFIDFSGSHD